jgi:hypothetical protein
VYISAAAEKGAFVVISITRCTACNTISDAPIRHLDNIISFSAATASTASVTHSCLLWGVKIAINISIAFGHVFKS